MIHSRSTHLYATVFLPPALFTVANTTSMAAGAAVACVIAMLAQPKRVLTDISNPGAGIALPLLLCICIVVHALTVSSFLPVDLDRAAWSLALAVVFVLGAHAISHALFDQAHRVIDAACRRVFLVLVLILPIAFLELIPAEAFGKNRIIFPFSEPSVFALAGMPFLAYMTIRSRGWKRLSLLMAAFAVATIIQNLTMIIGLALVAIICLRLEALILLGALILIGATFVDLTYFSDRLSISSESENLSSLVYLQGWQLIAESMYLSTGLGIGFQQLGVLPTAVPAAALIYSIAGIELNLSDGGFLLAKVLSEFGVFGLAAIIFFGKLFIASALQLRRAGRDSAGSPGLIFARCVFVCFALDIFVRGAGYFSGTTLLFLASLQYLGRQAALGKRRAGPRYSHRAAVPLFV